MNFILQLIGFILRIFSPPKPKPVSDKPDNAKTVVQPAPAPAPEPQPPADEQPTPDPEPAPEEPAAPETPAPIGELRFTENFKEVVLKTGEKVSRLKSVTITDGQVEGSFSWNVDTQKNWEGWGAFGKRKMKDFIQAEPELLQELEMTQSSRNILQPISDNEGNLEALNAYDSAFLSFGIFQWTLGTGKKVGELPALLKKLKDKFPDAFQQYFGRYGVDIDPSTNGSVGYLTLDGKKIESPELKNNFRKKEWVYRFWRAGGDRLVQAIQVEHALSRLLTFYWTWKVSGFKLNEIITSEFGVGLLLDTHVNLPIMVKLALRKAMDDTGLTDPASWTSEEEQKVLESYIANRALRIDGFGPVSHAINRAEKIRSYVEKGLISNRRGTFRFSMIGTRGAGNSIPMPEGFDPNEYPDLEMDIEGRDMDFGSREDLP